MKKRDQRFAGTERENDEENPRSEVDGLAGLRIMNVIRGVEEAPVGMGVTVGAGAAGAAQAPEGVDEAEADEEPGGDLAADVFNEREVLQAGAGGVADQADHDRTAT